MKKNKLLSLVALLFCYTFTFLTTASAKDIPLDGTYLLRSQKTKLDASLHDNASLNSTFRNSVKISQLRYSEMTENTTKLSFQVYNFSSGTYEHRYGILMKEGKYCHVFVDSQYSQQIDVDTQVVGSDIQKTFDNEVYPTVTSWFGDLIAPDSFQQFDPKVYIFLTDISDEFENGYVAGYFDHRDIEGLLGNQKFIFFMDLHPAEASKPNDKANNFYRTLAHEFQHMINFTHHHSKGLINEKRWLDEGMAMFSEFVFSGTIGDTNECIPPNPHLTQFLEKPQINLISSDNQSWFSENTLFRHYGASFLFTWYLVNKYGGETIDEKKDFTKKLVNSSKLGTKAIDDLLEPQSLSFSDVFMNWVCALYLDTDSSNNHKWKITDAAQELGFQAKELPLKSLHHVYTKENTSFLGGAGNISANSLNAETFSGSGTIKIEFSGEEGLTPFVARLCNDGTSVLQKVILNASNSANFIVDLEKNSKVLIAPVAINGSDDSGTQLNYSYRTETDGLLLYPIPNPIFSDQFIIILKSFSGPLLATPSLVVSFNNLIDRPLFTNSDTDSSINIAQYRIPGTGKGQAVVYYGDNSCSFSFSAATLRSGQRASIINGDLSLNVAANKINNRQLLLLEAISTNILPEYQILSRPFSVIGEIDDLVDAQLSYKTNKNLYTNIGFICIENGKKADWLNVNYKNGCYESSITHSGIYQLARDSKAPEIIDFKVSSVGNSSIVIHLSAFDNLSGIDLEKTELDVDGFPAKFSFHEEKAGSYIVRVDNVSDGNHSISLSLRDVAGNVKQSIMPAVVSVPVSVTQTLAVPNPCKNKVLIMANMQGSAANVAASYGAVKIFDVSGTHIISLPLLFSGNKDLSARWDCRSSEGKLVSNGVYFFKAKIYSGSETIKSRGKLVVLR